MRDEPPDSTGLKPLKCPLQPEKTDRPTAQIVASTESEEINIFYTGVRK